MDFHTRRGVREEVQIPKSACHIEKVHRRNEQGNLEITITAAEWIAAKEGLYQ